MKLITDYYNNQNIKIINWMKKDIDENNHLALFYVEYAIKNLMNIKGVKDLLKDISEIEETEIKGERIYHNSIMELHAIYFVDKTLKLRILEVESKNNTILSPNRKGDKSCDIKALNCNKNCYFESKDASSEITTSYVRGEMVHFTPMFEEQIKKWIQYKTEKADDKGANYLICRVPVWRSEEEFYNQWADRIINIKKKISRNNFIVEIPFKVSPTFKGIYIIKPDRYLLLNTI